jgi:CRP/FNR family transcriptional regulator
MTATRSPDVASLIEKLRLVPVFERLDLQVLALVVQSAVWREYAAGAIIYLEGEIVHGFYYLHTGWLKEVKISPEGREQILQYLGPGEMFNYLGLFVDRPNLATAIALEPAGVWLLQRSSFYNVLATHPHLGLRVAEALADYTVHLVQLVSDLSLHTVEARLAQRLLEQAEDNVVHRQRWATQAEMAARLGTVPDVIGRALQKLVEEQLIRVERQRIWILDRAGLAAKAVLES